MIRSTRSPDVGRSAPRKLVRGAAIVVAAVALLYEVGANVALTSHAVAHLLSGHPEQLRVEYAHATTFWPGRVHGEGLEVRSRSGAVEWQLHIDEADADISLLALLRHRFHVAKVGASGVTFRVRLRLRPDAVDPDRVARMPPIDGFDPVPLRGVPPDPDARNGKPWTVDLQGISADKVREVWIDAFRVAGVLEARGGFTVGAGLLTLAPSVAAIQSVDVTTGEDPITLGVMGGINAQMDTVDLNVVQGAAVLRFLTTQSALQGRVGGVAFLEHLVRSDALTLSGGEGTFRGTANVVRGLVKTGTTAHIALEPATVVIAEHAIAGQVHLDFAAGDGQSANDASTSSLELSELSLTESGHKAAAVTCKTLSTSANVQQIDLAEPESSTRDFAYSWETPRVDVLDLHVVDATLPKDSPFHIEHGTAQTTIRGHGSLSGASAQVVVDSAASMQIWGARVDSVIKGRVPLEGRFVAGTLDLTGTELALADPGVAGWWAQVKLGRAAVHFRPASVALSIATTARDGAPFLAFSRASQASSPVADVAMAVIPRPLTEAMTANLRGAVHLTAWKGALDMKDLDVSGAASRLRGALKKRGDKVDGGLLVEAGPTAVGISFSEGKVSPVVVGATRWFETSVAVRSK